MGKGKFDVGARAKELLPESVVIGEHELTVRRSGDAMEKVMQLDTGAEDASDKEQASLAVSVLYTSLSYLLVDRDGHNPDPEWLKQNIDFEVASDLLGELMPGSDDANPPAPVAPAPPSSPALAESP